MSNENNFTLSGKGLPRVDCQLAVNTAQVSGLEVMLIPKHAPVVIVKDKVTYVTVGLWLHRIDGLVLVLQLHGKIDDSPVVINFDNDILEIYALIFSHAVEPELFYHPAVETVVQIVVVEILHESIYVKVVISFFHIVEDIVDALFTEVGRSGSAAAQAQHDQRQQDKHRVSENSHHIFILIPILQTTQEITSRQFQYARSGETYQKE